MGGAYANSAARFPCPCFFAKKATRLEQQAARSRNEGQSLARGGKRIKNSENIPESICSKSHDVADVCVEHEMLFVVLTRFDHPPKP